MIEGIYPRDADDYCRDLLNDKQRRSIRWLYEHDDFRRFPVDYAVRLVTTCDKLEDPKNPTSFVNRNKGGLARLIGWRIFQEHTNIEGHGSDPLDHSRNAFKDYVDRETHYELERLKGKDNLGKITKQEYEVVLNQVFEAIVKRAVELFNEHDGYNFPINPTDLRNLLRVDLRESITRQSQIQKTAA